MRCSLPALVERDTKGLYASAARGEMELLTGVSDSFDEPARADIIIDTDRLSLSESYAALCDLAGKSLSESRNWRQVRQELPLKDMPGRPELNDCLL